jgi:hypothetical protein
MRILIKVGSPEEEDMDHGMEVKEIVTFNV